MIKFKEDCRFVVCSPEELIEKGWEIERNEYFHDDFPKNCINEKMLKYKGRILTVKNESTHLDWYIIKEDFLWSWPVATFMPSEEDFKIKTTHICIEGMTELWGWAICKICGINLRKIK